MNDFQDGEILRFCKRPGSEAFEEGFKMLYSKYKDLVYRVCYRVAGNSADAMDAAQDAFIQVYKNLSGFQGNSKFSSWLYRVAVNCAVDICRKRKRNEAVFVDIEGSQEFFDSNALLPNEGRKPDLGSESEFLEMISGLSPKLRLVTILRYLEGLTYSEIAEALQVAVGTVKSRLSRAHLAIGANLKAKARMDNEK